MTTVRVRAAIICVLLWTVYAVVAWVAVCGKSPTVDEPNHATVGWLMLYRGDFRASPDVPPLWEYWISLPLGPSGIHLDPADPGYRNILPGKGLFVWVEHLLYQTPGNDGNEIVQKCRGMALILAVVLGGLISFWAWKLAGPIAAVAATALWAMDPNMLGHGPLAKNDIALTLAYAWLAFAVWSAGTRLTWRSAASLCLAVAVGPGIKLSGIVFLPVAAFTLLIRAILPRPWPVLGWMATRLRSRLGAVFVVMIVAGIAGYVLLWACYRFRFNAGPGDLRLDVDHIATNLRDYLIASANAGKVPTPEQIAAWQPDVMLRFLDLARQHHLLPEAWIAGCLFTRFSEIHHIAYLLGETYYGGKWSYFPLAFLFKEPLGTLAAVAVSVIVGFVAIRHGRLKGNFAAQWAALSLGIPAGIYTAAAMSANVDLGLRYIFAIYPFIFVAIGWAVASLWAKWRAGRFVLIALAAGLALETAAAFPDFIAFFNIACGGSRGGFSLLADSNLDWGQDLPLLAQWQRNHPNENLYLIYTGEYEASAFHIRATRLRRGTGAGAYPRWPAGGGVVAIGATALQDRQPGDFASYFSGAAPDEVLGGSIYLFRFSNAPLPPSR